MLTNFEKTDIYTGVTNNLAVRLIEHWLGLKQDAFTNKYKVHYLVWFEETKYVLNAIAKEKELKSMSRTQKDSLIMIANSDWLFFNEALLGNWPPNEEQIAVTKERVNKNKFT